MMRMTRRSSILSELRPQNNTAAFVSSSPKVIHPEKLRESDVETASPADTSTNTSRTSRQTDHSDRQTDLCDRQTDLSDRQTDLSDRQTYLSDRQTDLSDDQTPTQPACTLKGVIAYVEVRTNNDNRSRAISGALKQLGAVVVLKFTHDVTHVVYKEGKKRTLDKALKKNVHLVSVLWVDSCKKNNEHVSEKLFPAIMPTTMASPVPFPRLKKMKSMQPSDFHDEVLGSSERCEKKRKRVAALTRFQVSEETPEIKSPTVLVCETQPRSVYTPHLLAASSRWTTPVQLTVPDTPSSMKKKLEELKLAKLNGTDFSPLARPNDDMEPLIRKLFDSNFPSDEEEEEEEEEDPIPLTRLVPSSESNKEETIRAKVRKKKTLLTEPVRLTSFLVDPSNGSGVRRPGGVSSENTPAPKPRTRPWSATDSAATQRTSDEDQEDQENQDIAFPASGYVTRFPERRYVKGRCSGPSSLVRKRKVGQSSDRTVSDERHTKKTKHNGETKGQSPERNGQSPEQKGQGPRKCLKRQRSVKRGKDVPTIMTVCRTDTSDISGSDTSGLRVSDRSGMLGASMSVVLDRIPIPGIAKVRYSIDEFSVGKPKHRNSKAGTLKLVFDQAEGRKLKQNKYCPRISRPCVSLSSIDSGDETSETSMDDTVSSKTSQPTRIKLRRANSFTVDKSISSNRSIVMTSLHTCEQETVISIIRKLGGFLMTNNVDDTTTHVVCGDTRRTLNLLAAVARGCWVLDKEWIFKSVEAGRWVDEEPYELGETFPEAKRARLQRQAEGLEYKQTLLSDCGPMYVSSQCVPPRAALVSLISLCGGQVTKSLSRCSLHIGPIAHRKKTSIRPVWLLDCIMDLKLLPYDKYLLHPISRRESSPEF